MPVDVARRVDGAGITIALLAAKALLDANPDCPADAKYKVIVLGKGGQTIKKISSQSRNELARIIEHDVHLFLFVKVREHWPEDKERLRNMGLDV